MRSRTHSLRDGITALSAAALLATTVGVTASISSPSTAAHASDSHMKAHAKARSRPAIKLRNDMRRLWGDHVTWTRMFIVSFVADLPDADAAAGRLLANQDDIGDAITPYYGDAAGEQLSALLRDHILIAVDILTAAKAGDTAGVEESNARWHDNANEIADFLSAANGTNWPQAAMRSMMSDHLDWTLAEAVARLNADWDADVQAYDRIHDDILHMADMLSFGIIKQFPGRF